ncbi:lipocalin family protein [Aggregatimonas sangjinii]|uniref:Lipocalin family protein n=1 Tax=Aggregatimonas sangjinii TaxID=2583587 RepID=A0A5B7STF8_9FLAO|nr:lipocalin family protein [Aggregatimonas sangjinii]QCW99973.1 lipocalin family protein [Aggregatimonas sangjinii]
MNKTLILFAALATALSSCSVSKQARQQENTLSGTWILNNVSYENGEGNFSSVIFNDAKDICFEGSNWFFRNNNNTGRYTIAQSTLCEGGDRYIRWSVVDGSPNQLQLKRIDEKYKDISGGVGYRLNISEMTENAMVLKSNVSVGAERVTIVYEFTKK